MNLLLIAAAFLLICLGVVAIAAIPLLLSKSRREDEMAAAINVSTQIQAYRYNSALDAIRKQYASVTKKKPLGNLHPIKGGKDGPGKGDDPLQ